VSKKKLLRAVLGKQGRKYKNARENSTTVSFMFNIISDKHTIDVMGNVCGIQGNEDKCTQVYGGKRLLGCHRREWYGNTATNLKRPRKEGCRLDSSGPGYKPVAGCCDHTNNFQVPQIKKFLDYLRNISFLTMCPSVVS
jgi:hypothetical protein